MYSPPTLVGGGSGDFWTTQYVGYPWGAYGAVWLQCTTQYVAGDGQRDFGIQEITFRDDQGLLQRQNVGGDDSSPYGSLVSRLFVPLLVGVTTAIHTYDASIRGTITFFEWG